MPTHRKLVPRKKFDKNGVLTTRNHAVDSKEFIQEKLSRKAELEKTLKASNDRVSGDGDTTEIKERDHEGKDGNKKVGDLREDYQKKF